MKKFFIILVLCIGLISCIDSNVSVDNYIFGDDTVVMTVSEIPVTYDIFRYYYLSLKINYEDPGKEEHEKLMDECCEAVKYYASMFVFASENNVFIDENDISVINYEISSYESFYGNDGFSDLLDELNHTRNSYTEIAKWQILREKCLEALSLTESELERQISDTVNRLEVVYDTSFYELSPQTIK